MHCPCIKFAQLLTIFWGTAVVLQSTSSELSSDARSTHIIRNLGCAIRRQAVFLYYHYIYYILYIILYIAIHIIIMLQNSVLWSQRYEENSHYFCILKLRSSEIRRPKQNFTDFSLWNVTRNLVLLTYWVWNLKIYFNILENGHTEKKSLFLE